MNKGKTTEAPKVRRFMGFDKWMRYQYAMRQVASEHDVIDVGGGRGDFLRTCSIDGVVLDMIEEQALFGKERPPCQLVRYGGGIFPVKDRAVPVVLSLDCLEHVPQDQRREFLSELTRISSDKIVMTFPVGKQHFFRLLLVIARVHSVIRKTSVAEKSLREHAANGLPTGDDVISDLESRGWRVESERCFGYFSSMTMLLQYIFPLIAYRPMNRVWERMLSSLDFGPPSYLYLTAHRSG